jgi:hypothetical protein
MKRVVGCRAWSIVLTLIMLGGCNGSQSTVPPTLPKSAPGAALVSRSSLDKAPGTRRSGPLLYVSDGGDNFLYVFSLPDANLVQKITGFAAIAGVCSDKEGNIFVLDSEADSIKEYAHGGKEPIAVLNDPEATPIGCSVDPTTENLAVANEITVNGTDHVEPGDIAIYTNAKGTPKDYTDPSMVSAAFDSYDGTGNLYVSGVADSYQNSDFAVLHRGANKLTNLSLNQSFSEYSALQWDGQYLAVASESDNQIYRFKISGTKGRKVGTTQLVGASAVYDFWIQKHDIYAPVRSNDQPMVGFYPYPKGGRPTKTLLGFAGAFSATVSIVP